MSGYSVIYDISNSLVEVLRKNMPDLVTQDRITLLSPAEAVVDTAPQLCLFLYQVLENHHLKNQKVVAVSADRSADTPLTIDLYYLMTAYAQSRDSEMQVFGRALQILNDYRIIRGSLLKGSIAGSPEEIKPLLQPLSLDDMNKLWSMFSNKPYRLSMAYRVSGAQIDSTRTRDTARVTSRVTQYGTFDYAESK